jgi:hypothetical protein
MRLPKIAVPLSFLLSVVLAGCSADFGPGPAAPGQTAFGNLSGYAHGGQQAIAGATVEALQTSTTAYGGASSVLATTTTDANGYFSFPASTTCTTNTVVYLYSVGGNPGSGTNSAAGLMAVLGTCPADGLLINAITTGTSVEIFMNEVSTVAAAYALAGFAYTSANVPTDALHIGALTTSDTLAQTGIQNAAANAAQMYAAVVSASTVGGGLRSALTTTPGGNGIVPQAEIDTLANVLAFCINSSGPGSAACSNSAATPGLLYYATSDGTPTGTQATDTATAALNIAHHPAANVTALYNLVGSTADPFTPSLTTVPSNFTVALSFTGGGVTASVASSPHNVAIDGSGNVWTSTQANVLCEFNPLGVPVSATGYTGNGMNQPTSVAIDATSQYVWVANFGGTTVSRFTTAGAAASSFTPGGSQIQDVEFDGSGDAWVTAASNQVDKLSLSGAVLATATSNGLNFPVAVALEPGGSGSAWVPNLEAADVSVFNSTTGVAPGSPVTTGAAAGVGVAIDASGNAWVSNVTGSVSKFSSAGTAAGGSPFATGTTLGGTGDVGGSGIAIDGAGNAWIASPYTKTIYELSNAGVNLSTTAGFAVGPTAAQPNGLAVDGSGNVWYDDESDSVLHEIVGAAVPVTTPLANGVANDKVGTRP